MATKKITFDPDADSSPAANFTILGGSDFSWRFSQSNNKHIMIF